ncbi:MAG: sulfopyruvate decarboxylase subunit alpha, partial [Nitrospirae bacterium]|nr:sulfopyruvate decarboxylase subunit alpha [Nitrospirota bacterium]
MGILKKSRVDFICSLPCEKIKILLELIEKSFFHVPLTREEEGVGICAGAALSNRRPAMFVQSSGIGNMINALLSLTGFYRLPLAIFVSHRGIYKEKIPAQIPMGRTLAGILKGAGIGYTNVSRKGDLRLIEKKLKSIYQKEKIYAFLLSPAVWEGTCEDKHGKTGETPVLPLGYDLNIGVGQASRLSELRPKLTRFEILKIIAPYLNSKVVVCNLGFPAKELFYIKHQPSNFYMLGSMGMATPIGLGIALTSKKEVVVIDGDG